MSVSPLFFHTILVSCKMAMSCAIKTFTLFVSGFGEKFQALNMLPCSGANHCANISRTKVANISFQLCPSHHAVWRNKPLLSFDRSNLPRKAQGTRTDLMSHLAYATTTARRRRHGSRQILRRLLLLKHTLVIACSVRCCSQPTQGQGAVPRFLIQHAQRRVSISIVPLSSNPPNLTCRPLTHAM
jgi:hypothetical protein